MATSSAAKVHEGRASQATPSAAQPAPSVPAAVSRESEDVQASASPVFSEANVPGVAAAHGGASLSARLATLTPRQREVFDLFVRCIESDGRPPRVRELCDATGITINALSDRLKGLVRKGVLDRVAARANDGSLSTVTNHYRIVGVRWRMVPTEEG